MRTNLLSAVAGVVALLFLAGTDTALAQTSEGAQCKADLEAHRARLQAVMADLQRDGLTQDTIDKLIKWRDLFRADIERQSLGDKLEGALVGGSSSVLASVMLGGPPGYAAAALGSLLGAVYVDMKELLATVASWSTVDANTVFYQFLIDYNEYGRVNDTSGSAMQRFVSDHASVLRQLTGHAPPTDPAALSLYLRAHSDRLLLFFGYFEESLGPTSFPRWRFPQIHGRHGNNRIAIGYYRKILAERLMDQLRTLDAELKMLQESLCAGTPPQELPLCASAPAPGVTQTCRCDITAFSVVWGSDVYTSDSAICTAAVHRGAISPRQRPDGTITFAGFVQITGAPGCPYYRGTSSNGIVTKDYGAWGGSFFFKGAQSGLCDERSRPPQGQWYCPTVMSPDATSLSCYCSSHAITLGNLWGSGTYTDDSGICKAARHAGRIPDSGGVVNVRTAAGLQEYRESESNGIKSSPYGAWSRSIVFQ